MPLIPLACSVRAAADDTTASQPRLVIGPRITPPAPATQDLGSIPMNITVSPDGHYAVTTDMGYRETLWSIGTADGKGVSHVDFPSDRDNKRYGLYYGLVFAPDNTLYAAQGGYDSIAVLTLAPDGTLKAQAPISTKSGDFPAGLALDSRGDLYVTNNDSEEAAVPSSLAIYDTKSRTEIGRYIFGATGDSDNFPLS
ncbi:MAG: hypothetical protein ACLQVD_14480, partial [Capsulimonadaceae bacterium]